MLYPGDHSLSWCSNRYRLWQGSPVHALIQGSQRTCALDFKGNWNDLLLFVEFAYNSSYLSTIGMSLLEALYDHKCMYPIRWDEIGETKLFGPELVQQTVENVLH